jgi:hypothetical protein
MLDQEGLAGMTTDFRAAHMASMTADLHWRPEWYIFIPDEAKFAMVLGDSSLNRHLPS